jgi:cytochrome c biogenesis protein CcmG/thiol:disulfide interchange protein DsbE
MYKIIPLLVLIALISLIAFAIYNLPSKKTTVKPELIEAEQIINADDAKILGKKPQNLEKNEPVAESPAKLTESSSSQLSFTKVNFPFPDFSLPNLYEPETLISKKDLLGKYFIVNFFASWCTTCIAEHQILFNLQRQNFVDIYGIAWQDLNENTIKFLKEKGNPYSKVLADGKGEFSKNTDLQAVPETWLIDPKGNVVLRWQGNLQDFAIEELEKYIRLNK